MKTLLLLHGAIGAKDQLSPLAKDLRNHYEIHNLNFSGHGGCDFDSAFSIENFAAEVLNYLNTMKIETASIFGYSMGGYVALYFASKHAERVEKIVTLATKFEWSPEISQKETKMLNPEIIKEKIPAFAKALLKRHHPQSWETVLQRTSQMMLDLGNKQPLSDTDFQNIYTPVKLLIGQDDKMVTIEETVQVANGLPNSECMILAEIQHPIEKVPVSLLATEIKNFIK